MYFKLLEIYVKCGDVDSFNCVVLNLYVLSGGLNEVWVKVVVLGLIIDLINLFYGGMFDEFVLFELGMEFDLFDFKVVEV